MSETLNPNAGDGFVPELLKRSARTEVRAALQVGVPIAARKGNQLIETRPNSSGKRRVVEKLEPGVKVEKGARLILL